MKKTSLDDFANVRKGGIIAIGIEPGDTLIEVKLTDRFKTKSSSSPAKA